MLKCWGYGAPRRAKTPCMQRINPFSAGAGAMSFPETSQRGVLFTRNTHSGHFAQHENAWKVAFQAGHHTMSNRQVRSTLPWASHDIPGAGNGLIGWRCVCGDSYRWLPWWRSPSPGDWYQNSAASCWSRTLRICHHWWSQRCSPPQFHPVQQGTKS